MNACFQSNEELLTEFEKKEWTNNQRPFKRLKCRKSEGTLQLQQQGYVFSV